MRKFLWAPDLGMYGIQRMEFLDDVTILCGSGVGGGSNVYANTLYVPPRPFFQAREWAGITDWEDELAPFYDQAVRMLGVVRVPYMDTDADRMLREIAAEMGRGHTYDKAPVGVYFGTPGVEVDDPYFGGEGPRRTGCISCGECMIGCRHGAKNKLSKNYLYLAEKYGAVVHDLRQVTEIRPMEDGGYEVMARHPGMRGPLRGAGPIHRGPGHPVRPRLRDGQVAPPDAPRGAPRWALGSPGQAGAHQLRGDARERDPLRRLEEGPAQVHQHAGLGGHHLGDLARRRHQHRAGLLRRRQQRHGVPVHASHGRAPRPIARWPGRRNSSSIR